MKRIKLSNILFNILTILTVIAVVFVGYNLIAGNKGYAVIHDSMSPVINRGDVVFVKAVAFDDLKRGDIITAKFKDSENVFTHQIIEIDKSAHEVWTKGENNPSADPDPTGEEQILGRVVYHVPFLGYLSVATSSEYFMYILVIFCAVVLLVIMLVTALLKRKKAR